MTICSSFLIIERRILSGILSSKYVLWFSKENELIKGGNAEISDFIANCDLFVLNRKNLGK